MRVVVYPALEALPSSYDVLFAAAASRSFYLSRSWFENLVATTMDQGDRLQLFGVADDGKDGEPLALLVARARSGNRKGRPARTLAAYTTVYTTEFDLLLAPGFAEAEAAIEAIIATIADAKPAYSTIEVRALAADDGAVAALGTALRRHGYGVAQFHQFGSWFARTHGKSYAEFSHSLPKGLRQLRKKLDRADGPRFTLVTGLDEIQNAIGVYQQLYLESWKEPEPYPLFVPGLVQTAAAAGVLRLGLLYVDGKPAAAQVWIVAAGRATIFKVVHSERFKRLSPGSILTTRMLEHVIDVDKVAEVDFGRGDDDYKRMWLPQRREFWAILAYNPRTLHGAYGGLRHVALAPLARRCRSVAVRLRAHLVRSGSPWA